jgi:hypothetical protein
MLYETIYVLEVLGIYILVYTIYDVSELRTQLMEGKGRTVWKL